MTNIQNVKKENNKPVVSGGIKDDKIIRRGANGRNTQRRQGQGGPGGDEFEKKVLQVDRISRTVRGGRRIRFRTLVIVGNRQGRVGMGVGKATEVVEAVEKANRVARKNLMDVPIINGTIPHQIEMTLGSAHILLKPAKVGTSIVAGGTIRTICELAGIKNIVGKILGTANKINNSKVTFEAFKRLANDVEHLKDWNVK